MLEINRIYNEDCTKGMERIDDGMVDCILTDPPYLYLKNQKLDIPFDEEAFFTQAARVLKKDAFIVLFGRGTSFYRWNTALADLGFKFKEEIVWNKIMNSSPVLPLQRVHETISFHCRGNGKINKVKVPYVEKRKYEVDRILSDMKRFLSGIKKPGTLEMVVKYLESMDSETLIMDKKKTIKYNTSLHEGDFKRMSVEAWTARSMTEGLFESDIITELRDHYKMIHPTEKPVRLLERLLALVTLDGDLVLDPFSGSASTAVAAKYTGRNFIGFEIDREFFEAGNKRLMEKLI
jgi:site-specific DNA-methyltransferase (adenine-specific)